MKTVKTFVFSLVLLTAGTIFSNAQDHHKAPHGGKVQDAVGDGGYHIELVKVKDSLNFYVLYPEGKPAGKITNPRVEYEFSNKTKSMSPLIANPGGKLAVAMPKANIVEFATVMLVIDGKEVSAKFKNEVSDEAKKHGHEH